MADAITGGMLTVAGLEKGAAATHALLPDGVSPVQLSPAERPASMALGGQSEEAAELLDDFLVALLDLPGDAWPDIAAALPASFITGSADISTLACPKARDPARDDRPSSVYEMA